ncbi:MAG: hypothetical protein M1835_001643 [Candelina submexicana]|nr:MAG: hypothetical protein M1835_001643 [Candelina submexicana]
MFSSLGSALCQKPGKSVVKSFWPQSLPKKNRRLTTSGKKSTREIIHGEDVGEGDVGKEDASKEDEHWEIVDEHEVHLGEDIYGEDIYGEDVSSAESD